MATDNILVSTVLVTNLAGRGQILEYGEAMPAVGPCWEYVTVMQGKVMVEACDLAGNTARQA